MEFGVTRLRQKYSNQISTLVWEAKHLNRRASVELEVIGMDLLIVIKPCFKKMAAEEAKQASLLIDFDS